MTSWMNSLFLLAQNGNGGGGNGAGGGNGGGGWGGLLMMMIPFIVIILLFQFMFGGQQRKEQRRKEELVKSLKKNDRVVTIGGITGTVASISEDNQFVTIKVEDNTRIKMLASSIQNVEGRNGTERREGVKPVGTTFV